MLGQWWDATAGAAVSPGLVGQRTTSPLCLCLAYGMCGGGVHRCGSGQPLVEMRCDDFDLLPVEATMWAAARLGTGEEP
jgi:hypothetical protein